MIRILQHSLGTDCQSRSRAEAMLRCVIAKNPRSMTTPRYRFRTIEAYMTVFFLDNEYSAVVTESQNSVELLLPSELSQDDAAMQTIRY